MIRAFAIAAYVVTLSMGFASTCFAQSPPGPGVGYSDTPMLPNSIWRVHDKLRPRPPLVEPGAELGSAPSDAVVLFDGTNLDQWKLSGSEKTPAPWKVVDGVMECAPKSGTIQTRQEFGDIQLHIEWSAPEKVEGSSQGRGNSGVIIMGRYEIQVLDSYQNDTYADGQAGSIYGQYPPQVNVTRAPGKWNVYDIVFEAPRFEGEKLVKPAKATVFHNGVLVQNAKELIGPMAHQEIAPYRPHPPTGPIVLQDHGNPTRFRNIWVRSLREESVPWLTLTPSKDKPLPGNGKKVVLVSGDEEYRSEEALPMLAKILTEQHGFECSVLFSINPSTNTIDPNYTSNIPGLHLLDDADAMILFTRFRSPPDWQMQHFDKFVKAGKPFIAIRTATHPFNFPADRKSAFQKWSWNSSEWPGGFGQQIIGETWHSHHGVHNGQATRGIINEAEKNSPILKGVSDVFGPSDVYGVVHLPATAKVLMYGQVLKGMKPTDPPLEGEKNTPMMPLVWTKDYQMEGGKPGKVLGSTIGAAVDLTSADLRRLFVNATYWATGLEDKIPEKASVDVPESYKPNYFGFRNEKGFFTNQNLKPQDMLRN